MDLIKLIGAEPEADIAESVDFDGTNDYLSRSSDLVGNTDSKTFTFSTWVYIQQVNDIYDYAYLYGSTIVADGNTDDIGISVYPAGLTARFRNGATTVLYIDKSDIPTNTGINILFAVDMSNPAKRHLYISDILQDDSVFTVYEDITIVFTNPEHFIELNSYYGLSTPTVGESKNRKSHTFLDYTYRDLSVEANRRLFITADGKPADGQAALNPILYLPMTDPTTAHINKGTGGNFTLNGTIARSGRGPNQDNCVASEFDGSADYLSKSGSIGAVTGKSFTFSFNVKAVDLGLIGYIGFLVGTTNIFSIAIDPDLRQNFILNEADGTNAAYARLEYVDLLRRNISLQIESDSSGTLKIYLNDTDISGTIVWITSPTGQDYGFGSIDTVFIGRSAAASTIISGTIGEVYFHTPKLGLSAANHFFDSDTNKPIPVRQVIETTGVTPLIAMPLRADNPGKNLGSGGDFTEYSAPFAGARGASEFWARSMHSDGTTDYLSKTSTLTGSADGKTVTLVGAWYPDDVTGNEELFNISTAIPAQRFQAQRTGTTLTIKGWNASGTEILNVTVASFFAATTWVTLLASIDLSNSSNRSIYKDGVVSTPTWTTYTDDNIELSAAHSTLCAADAGAGFYDGMTGFFYFDASYIDFSQESNRLLFIDAFDYPTDIENQISDGNVTNPLILMLMKNTASFGTNSGAGGNYTVNGTPVAGADVKG